jgi:hypothetical protein
MKGSEGPKEVSRPPKMSGLFCETSLCTEDSTSEPHCMVDISSTPRKLISNSEACWPDRENPGALHLLKNWMSIREFWS